MATALRVSTRDVVDEHEEARREATRRLRERRSRLDGMTDEQWTRYTSETNAETIGRWEPLKRR
jgi:hypothetical protein